MKNNTQSILFILLFFMIAISACNYDTVIPETVDPGDQISFQDDLIPIFNADCNSSGCHAAGDVAPDLSPENAYDALINGNYIDINDPESSELYQWVSGNRSAPMPINGTDAQTVAITLLWIQQGALDN